MTYIKDLIHIPDHVGRGDFVLRLSEGATAPEGTVKHYQVRPPLHHSTLDLLSSIAFVLPWPN